mmetsp:Transcript_99316/g.252249  ORF Transcript_99316/g.252249 Transcript_99316/m.252249 type:complete len:467 (-) Transcript_99316:390-1790(-)
MHISVAPLARRPGQLGEPMPVVRERIPSRLASLLVVFCLLVVPAACAGDSGKGGGLAGRHQGIENAQEEVHFAVQGVLPPAFAVGGAEQGRRTGLRAVSPMVGGAKVSPLTADGASPLFVTTAAAAALAAAAMAVVTLLAGSRRRRRQRSRGGGRVVCAAKGEKVADDYYSVYHDGPTGISEEDEGEEGKGCDSRLDLECAVEEGVVDEEDICELLGYDLGEGLTAQIGRSFTAAERQNAYKACGFDGAVTSARPQAIWLIGPSASGKSTLAPSITSWVGVDEEGFVTVDGEPFRDCHQGYQDALSQGSQKGCVWWGAYVGIREKVNKEKQRMLNESVALRKHLVIPSTCLRKSQCVDVAQMLLDNNYVVHIVGVHGKMETIVARGQQRAREKGKRYDSREFTTALRQFGPMLELCNGRYRVVNTTPDTGKRFEVTDEGEGPLTAERIKEVCEKVMGKEFFEGQAS